MRARGGTAVRAAVAGVALLLGLPLLLPMLAGALITGVIARLYELTRRGHGPAAGADRR
jgi:hypothetical protein